MPDALRHRLTQYRVRVMEVHGRIGVTFTSAKTSVKVPPRSIENFTSRISGRCLDTDLYRNK